jgi:hypothetical protein
MQIAPAIIDDFKTDRKDISPPLPAYLRLVPIGLYLSILAAIILNSLFLLNYSRALRDKEVQLAKNSEMEKDLTKIKTDRTALENEAKKATDVINWVESARPLQPLLVDISRTIAPDATIVDLRVERNNESASQLKFALRLNCDTIAQLEKTLGALDRQQFRAISPTQTVSKGEVDYKATLIWQDATRGETPPEEPTK